MVAIVYLAGRTAAAMVVRVSEPRRDVRSKVIGSDTVGLRHR